MKSTLFAATVALLAAAVSAAPAPEANYGWGNKPSCWGPFGELPCGSTNATWYTVQAGEVLTDIATKFKSGICDIAKYNKLASPDKIDANQILSIPAQCKTPDNNSCINRATPGPSNDTCVNGLSVNPPVYVVLPMDSLTLISNKFNITLAALEKANPQVTNPNFISVNQALNVPICSGFSCTNKQYTIKSGDSFSAIATSNGITLGQIEAANPRQVPQGLQVGQVINVPVCKGVA